MPYIVVEGLDLSGKSSLCKKLKKHYGGESVYEPYDQTLISRNATAAFNKGEIGQFLTVHLMMLTRIEMFKNLGEHTKEGNPEFFFSDRNFLSTMVYQGKNTSQMNDILELNEEVIKNYGHDIYPDILILIEPSHNALIRRLDKREEVTARDKCILSKKYFHEMSAKYQLATQLLLNKTTRTTVLTFSQGMSFNALVELIDDVIEMKKHK